MKKDNLNEKTLFDYLYLKSKTFDKEVKFKGSAEWVSTKLFFINLKPSEIPKWIVSKKCEVSLRK